MTTVTATETRHVVLAMDKGTGTITVVDAFTSWGQAIDLWQQLDDARTSAADPYYMVRESDHELVAQAAEAEAARLPRRQREVLAALGRIGRPVKPGSRKLSSPDPRAWSRASGGMYPTDAVAPARKLRDRGLVRIGGLDFAPKTYALTRRGAIVAAAAARMSEN